jgi:hypothetical protein
MTTDVEQAEKTLNDLLDQRDEHIARGTKLAADRQNLAYAAFTNDKAAQAKLRKINDETVLHHVTLEGLESAVKEATQRLDIAHRADAQAKDRAQAEQLRAKLNQFTELGLNLDDCITDFVGAAKEMQTVLDDIHSLGCASPTAAQMRVLATLAIKSFVMQIPWTAKEWEHLPPNQRKTFKDLIVGWHQMIEQHIKARLGEPQQPNATETAA